MVLTVFFQIALIILDRYLYLSKKFIVIEEVELEVDDSDFYLDDEGFVKRRSTIDLRSPSDAEILKKNFRNTRKALSLHRRHTPIRSTDETLLRPTGDNSQREEGQEKDDRDLRVQMTDVNYAIITKYYLQWLLLVLVHFFVFWYWPMKGNYQAQGTFLCQRNIANAEKCNDFSTNGYLVTFYILYCCYFAISALQIRFGLPELRKGAFMMGGYTVINNGLMKGFLAIPFLFELRVITDWTFTHTSLDLF